MSKAQLPGIPQRKKHLPESFSKTHITPPLPIDIEKTDSYIVAHDIINKVLENT